MALGWEVGKERIELGWLGSAHKPEAAAVQRFACCSCIAMCLTLVPPCLPACPTHAGQEGERGCERALGLPGRADCRADGAPRCTR